MLAGSFMPLRRGIAWWQTLLFGTLCVALVFGVWFGVTYGEKSEDRIVSGAKIPSPAETFAPDKLKSLWFDRALSLNTVASLRRVILGFALAAAVGIPVGVFCGCYTGIDVFFAPINVFGRNVPMAALIPLTFILFGIDEFQKVMFIFLAEVAFVVFDTSRAVRDVSERYVDTAYTLGATRGQIIRKVIVPLAMPDIFNSLRLLFGLAFGYIMLAEVVQSSDEAGGLGQIITMSQRRGPREHIWLVLLIIPLIALAVDRLLYVIQVQLFPYRYGGAGTLARLYKTVVRGGGGLTDAMFGRGHEPPPAADAAASRSDSNVSQAPAHDPPPKP
jgi:NitT/TauT family transport system permease protein